MIEEAVTVSEVCSGAYCEGEVRTDNNTLYHSRPGLTDAARVSKNRSSLKSFKIRSRDDQSGDCRCYSILVARSLT